MMGALPTFSTGASPIVCTDTDIVGHNHVLSELYDDFPDLRDLIPVYIPEHIYAQLCKVQDMLDERKESL